MAKPTKQTPCDLAGLNILVTRPQEQANTFAEAIQQAHGRPIRFPAIEILGPADKAAVRSSLQALHNYRLLIFVSANAVRYAFPLMPDNIPLDLPIAAIGQATASALEEVGLDPTLQPQGRFDSEGLLNLPELSQVTGKKILIVRGNGGRETLKATLEQRGAQVTYAEVYRRQIPQRNPHNLIQNWAQMVDVATANSQQILDNLFTLLGEAGEPLLQQTPLLVASERIAKHAAERGCKIVYVADSALDKDMLAALCEINADMFV
jgi:uroporphyrinogen-III synthase